MISQNLLDQLTQNLKYAFSTRVTVDQPNYQNQPKNFFMFYIFLGFRSLTKNMQKSVIELHSIATFFFCFGQTCTN